MPSGVARQRPNQCREPFLCIGITPDIQAKLIERLAQNVDLRLCRRDFGFADVAEQAGADDAGKKADDDQNDQKFEKREA